MSPERRKPRHIAILIAAAVTCGLSLRPVIADPLGLLAKSDIPILNGAPGFVQNFGGSHLSGPAGGQGASHSVGVPFQQLGLPSSVGSPVQNMQLPHGAAGNPVSGIRESMGNSPRWNGTAGGASNVNGSPNFGGTEAAGAQFVSPPIYYAPSPTAVPGVRVVDALPAADKPARSGQPEIIAGQGAIYHADASHGVTLESGEVLIKSPGGTALVKTDNGTEVYVAHGADVLVESKDGVTRVKNLSGAAPGSVQIKTPHEGKVLALDSGHEFVAGSSSLSTADLQPSDDIARRSVTTSGDKTWGVAEISLATALKSDPLLVSVRKSGRKHAVDVVLKTAAAQLVVRGNDGFVSLRGRGLVNNLLAGIIHIPGPVPPPVVPPGSPPPPVNTGVATAPSPPTAVEPTPASAVINQNANTNLAPVTVSQAVDQTLPLLREHSATFANRSLARSREEENARHFKPAIAPSIKAPAINPNTIANTPAAPGQLVATAPPAVSRPTEQQAHGETALRTEAQTTSGGWLNGVPPAQVPKFIAREIQRHPDIAALVLALIAVLLGLTTYFWYMARLRAQQLVAINEELRVARDRALDASKAKSEFLANISHEIRTPIAAVLGTVSLLQGTKLSEKQRQLARELQSSGETLREIITSILDFSKIEAGRILLESVPFSPAEIINETTVAMKGPAASKKLPIRVSIDANVPQRLFGDPVRFKQILLNLLSNAVKFTEAGEVGIAATMLTGDSVELPRLRVSIKDTGIGINPDEREKLFQPFVQADSSTTRKFGGTGLGLSISRHLAVMMGGDIDFRSVPGEGTEFFVTLPFKTSDENQPDEVGVERSTTGDISFAGKRILVAEDSPVLQRIVKTQLESFGCIVDVANNGKEAIEAARCEQYSLIFMDWQMPEMDGLAATKAIRELTEGSAKAPIVAMTANAMEGDRTACLEAGMNDYLSKPFKPEQLQTLLERWLG